MLDTGTIIAVIIALTTSLTLMITSVLQNVRLERQRDYWYEEYMALKHASR